MVLSFPDDFEILESYREVDGWEGGRSIKLNDAVEMLGIPHQYGFSPQMGFTLRIDHWLSREAIPHVRVTPTGHLLFDVEEIQALTGRTAGVIHSMMQRWCEKWEHPANDFPEPPDSPTDSSKLTRVG